MPTVRFTRNLLRHIECPAEEVQGETVHEVLQAVFARHPQLQGYVLDDQDRLRRHMLIAVDGAIITDRMRLSDPVGAQSEVYVMQALSGG